MRFANSRACMICTGSARFRGMYSESQSVDVLLWCGSSKWAFLAAALFPQGACVVKASRVGHAEDRIQALNSHVQ